VLIPEGSPLFEALAAPARDARMVFFAGLPATGKSLLIRELAHLAHARGRRVHLLQWDVARPVFEASDAGRPYPQVRGITHGLIRLAAGGWARATVGAWPARHPGLDELLIGETPFIGHRFIDLARPAPDTAEAVLTDPATRFVIPVPSRAVRAHVEAERGRRAEAPVHPREREDAPPDVLRVLGGEIAAAAGALGIAAAGAGYDPDVYRQVYQRLLAHRHATPLPIDVVLPTAAVSAYEFSVPIADVVPTAGETVRYIRAAEAAHPHPGDVDRTIDGWYRLSSA
jgi:hypothetical protein